MTAYASIEELNFPPESFGELDIYEAITDAGMDLLSRELADGLRFKITHFSVGSGGVDWSVVPPRATPVDTSLVALEEEMLKKALDVPAERPNPTSISLLFRLAADEALGFVSEFGLWATIITSPVVGEAGLQVLFAVAHVPPKGKTGQDVFSHRMLLVL